MDCNVEKECSALGGLFQTIINDIKGSAPLWENLASAASKFQSQLRSTVQVGDAFVDALQRIADLATSTKGGARDIGTALTRVCLRHRSMENRLKTMSSNLADCLMVPLLEKTEDWKRSAVQMEKDHAKEYKRIRTEIKKRSMDTIRLQKKARKGCHQTSNSTQRILESATRDLNDRYIVLLEAERRAVRTALTEQRSQFSVFISWLKPFLDTELSLLNEVTHLQEVVELLYKNAADPVTLPADIEDSILNIKDIDFSFHYKTPPSSPGGSIANSVSSRKSSFCSLTSLESNGSNMLVSSSSCRASMTSGGAPRYCSMPPTSTATDCTASANSHDSGFTCAPLSDLYASNYWQPDQLQKLKQPASVPIIASANNGARKSAASPAPTVASWPGQAEFWAENGSACDTSATVPPGGNQAVSGSGANRMISNHQKPPRVPVYACSSIAEQSFTSASDNHRLHGNARLPSTLRQHSWAHEASSGSAADRFDSAKDVYQPDYFTNSVNSNGQMLQQFSSALRQPPLPPSAQQQSADKTRRPLSFVANNDDELKWIFNNGGDAGENAFGQFPPPPPMFDVEARDDATLTRGAHVLRRHSASFKMPPAPPARRTSTLSTSTFAPQGNFVSPSNGAADDSVVRPSCTTPTTAEDFGIYANTCSYASASTAKCLASPAPSVSSFAGGGVSETATSAQMMALQGGLLLEIQSAKVKLRKTAKAVD